MEIWFRKRDLPSHFENCVVFTATFHFLFRNSLGVNCCVEEPLRNLALCHKTLAFILIRVTKMIQVFSQREGNLKADFHGSWFPFVSKNVASFGCCCSWNGSSSNFLDFFSVLWKRLDCVGSKWHKMSISSLFCMRNDITVYQQKLPRGVFYDL